MVASSPSMEAVPKTNPSITKSRLITTPEKIEFAVCCLKLSDIANLVILFFQDEEFSWFLLG